ncbi:MarR family winged helix-turn-helix transcriptional regulator [Wukongibacter baidiensis]|uniref:MarR family winged helix-turn-helix transcriptional regulator n=1 Tax=Wukongibacter baidiensis TaxID=1723361 RepID=UPI003D7F7AEF
MTKEFEKNLGSDMSKTKLGYYIDQLEKIEKKILNAEFEKIGITLSQFRVLNWLWRKGELSQKEIHELIQIKPSSLTSLLNVLIKKGLVVRKFDIDDARVRKIVLTDKSKAIEKEAWHIIDGFDNRIRKILTDDEYSTTLKCLDKLIKNL